VSDRLKANQVTLLAEIGVIVAALIALGWLKTQAVAFSNIGPADVLNRLTPLILTAGFIERAIEVLISPWRDPEASRHATAIAAAKATPVSDDQAKVQKVQAVAEATDSLNVYSGLTKRYAFITGLSLGLIASLAGVSALSPFLAKDALNSLPAAQHALFAGFDIVLTAALLAGGADGLHSVISAFTSFFGATAQRVSNPS